MGAKKILAALSNAERAQFGEALEDLREDAAADDAPRPTKLDALAWLVREALARRRASAALARAEEEKRAAERREADEKAKAAATARAARDAVVKAAEAWYGPRLNDLASRVTKARAAADQARREAAGGMALPVGCSGEEWQARRADAEARAEVLQREADALAGDLSRLRAQFEEACKPQE